MERYKQRSDQDTNQIDRIAPPPNMAQLLVLSLALAPAAISGDFTDVSHLATGAVAFGSSTTSGDDSKCRMPQALVTTRIVARIFSI